jgi:hypothetical protein
MTPSIAMRLCIIDANDMGYNRKKKYYESRQNVCMVLVCCRQ